MKQVATTFLAVAALAGFTLTAAANNSYQSLPFTQDWSNVGLITLDDNWSSVPGIIGYRGDSNIVPSGTDPQTVTYDDIAANSGVVTSPVVDVNANKTGTDLLTFISGGVAEYELSDAVVGLNGSGTADAPYMVFHINSTGFTAITVSYVLRDIEDFGTDHSIQQYALQYRTATGTAWTDVPAGYVADATAGPALPLLTPVTAVLPAAADGQATLEIRVITANAVGSDEWVGVDDIQITGTPDAVPAQGATWGRVKSLYR